MKIIFFILLSFSVYSQTTYINGYWELIDYRDGKAQYKVTYGSTGGSNMGLFFSDSTIMFLDNIYFSSILSDKYTRTKEYIKLYSDNIYNIRDYKIINDKMYLSLYGNDEITELTIKIRDDTLCLINEVFDYEQIYLRKDYSGISPVNFSKLTFSTSYCLGNCPVFNLEIDSTGYLKFGGIDHILFLGKYEYQLHDTLLNEFKSLLNIINWTALDNDFLGVTHGPTMKTKVFCSDTLYKEIKDWTGPVPCELKWLYNYFKRISNLPFKQKVFDYNIFGNKTLQLKRISIYNDFKIYNNISESENVFILSELLNTSKVSKSFKTKFYFDTSELKWDENEAALVENDTGIIESDGKFFKFNSELFELRDENLSDYFNTLIEKER